MHNIIPDFNVVITTIISLLLVVLMIIQLSRMKDFRLAWIFRGCIALSIVIILYFLIQMPIYSYVNEDTIGVKLLISKKEFPKKEIIQVTTLKEKDFSGATRIFASGGSGGYIGWFKNPTIGKFYMIASSTKDLLLIQTETKKYVINCPLENVQNK